MFSTTLPQTAGATMVTTPGFFAVLVHTWKIFLGSCDSCAIWLQSMFSFTFLEEVKLYRQDMIEGAEGLDTPAGMVLKTISGFSLSEHPALRAGSRIIIECLEVKENISNSGLSPLACPELYQPAYSKVLTTYFCHS
jgi:hypothetical protein